MTRNMMWIGFWATVLIVVMLGLAVLREPARQEAAARELQTAAIERGTDLYAENCVICHGSSGEGLGAYPTLNQDGIVAMDYETLFKTIERGRYDTAMTAYGVEEGGIFTDAQIDSLITMLQYGSWQQVSVRVADLGLTPPEIPVVEVSQDTLASVAALPEGDLLASGYSLFMENCTACHGSNGEGTAIAPPLNSDELRIRLTDADITRIIQQGVPGTLMAGWDKALTAEEIAALTTLVRRWDEVASAGIEMPAIEVPVIDMSPEAIAEGQQLFNILCTQCHGVDGFGTPLAPALNNQTFLSVTPDAAIQQIIAQGVPGTAMPSWAGYLTEADIASITAYLRSWQPTAPTIVNQ